MPLPSALRPPPSVLRAPRSKAMRDFILEIFFDGDDEEERIQARLFRTRSTGSTSSDGMVAAYFDSPEDREAAAQLLGEFELQNVERERVDWLQVYQQSLEPTVIGERFIVAPEPIVIGERFIVAPDASLFPSDTDRFTIIVPQEQAFGTGSHETTSLCIEMLESLDLNDQRGLDVGSGSGILAIAMLLLGCKHVIAFDNDVDAYGALRDNRMRNRADYEIF